MFKSRTFLIGTLAIAMLLVAHVPGDTSQDISLGGMPVRFAILGDRTGGHVPGIYGQICDEIERLKPEFVMTVGDMIEGYTSDTAVYNAEWRELLQIVEGLSMPIHYTPGNHDITNEVGVGPYYEFIGDPYYSFDHRGLHIVVVDNSRWPQPADLPPEQLAWIEEDLAANQDAMQTMVFYHQPSWFLTTAKGEPDTLHQLFTAYGVDAVVTGHHHQYYTGTYDGIKYTSLGSSGGGIFHDSTYLGFHYAFVTVAEEEIYINPVRMGSVLPWDHITAEELFDREQVKHNAVAYLDAIEVTDAQGGQSAVIELSVTNLASMAIDDTLRWNDVGGWTVGPTAAPVALEPGDSAQFRFAVTVPSLDDMFPAPSLAGRLPYSEKRSVPVDASLRLARVIECGRLSDDGEQDRETWDKIALSPGVCGLVSGDGSSEATDSTCFKFMYDADALYIVVHCTERQPDSIVANATERDGAVYADDCVGFFLQPNPSDLSAFQFYLNRKGVMFDQRLEPTADGYHRGDRSWSLDCEPDILEWGDDWSVYMNIPWSAIGLEKAPEIGSWMGINFRRKQHGTKRISNFQVPIDYDPKTFGRLYFVDEQAKGLRGATE